MQNVESISGVFFRLPRSFKSTSIKYLSAPIKYLKEGVREFSHQEIAASRSERERENEGGRNLAFKKIEMQNLKTLFMAIDINIQ